jgi:hypothetical protein
VLLPNEDEYRLVIGLPPLLCKDPKGYAELIRSILPVSEPPIWMNAVRVVVYEDRSLRPLTPILQALHADRVLTFDVDFSTDAMADALAEDASARSLPLTERMLALLQLAALDYSYKRHELELAKYSALFNYYCRARAAPPASAPRPRSPVRRPDRAKRDDLGLLEFAHLARPTRIHPRAAIEAGTEPQPLQSRARPVSARQRPQTL